jgi:hypothetical protein
LNQTCSFRGSKSRNKVWISKVNDLSASINLDVGSFAEALAAIYDGAQSDLLQKNKYWRLNASQDSNKILQHCLIAGSS